MLRSLYCLSYIFGAWGSALLTFVRMLLKVPVRLSVCCALLSDAVPVPVCVIDYVEAA